MKHESQIKPKDKGSQPLPWYEWRLLISYAFCLAFIFTSCTQTYLITGQNDRYINAISNRGRHMYLGKTCPLSPIDRTGVDKDIYNQLLLNQSALCPSLRINSLIRCKKGKVTQVFTITEGTVLDYKWLYYTGPVYKPVIKHK